MSDVYIHNDGRIEIRQQRQIDGRTFREALFNGRYGPVMFDPSDTSETISVQYRDWEISGSVHGVQIFKEL